MTYKITKLKEILYGEANLDFGNIAANSQETLNITVEGTEIGDAVSLGIPNSSIEDSATFDCWVSAIDTVSIKLINTNTLLSIDPASGVFKVFVFKN